MNTSERIRSVTGCILAFIVPAAGFAAAAKPGTIAPAPFGGSELLVVHILTALPLAAMISIEIKRFSNIKFHIWILVPTGIGLAILTAASGPLLGELLDHHKAGFILRMLARTSWCVLLAVPWVALSDSSSPSLASTVSSRIAVATATAIGLGLPCVAALRLADDEANRAQELLSRGRLAAAAAALQRLAEVEPERSFEEGGHVNSVVEQSRALRPIIEQLSRALERTSPKSLSPAGRFDRAWVLIMLGRPAEALPELESLAATQPAARLLLGEAQEELGFPAAGEASIRAGLVELLERPGSHPRAAELCRTAFEALARLARARGDFAAAESVYAWAISAMPQHASAFRVSLGRHYQATGQPLKALEHWDAAVREDPSLIPQVQHLMRRIREQTPGCFIRPRSMTQHEN